MKTCSFLFVCSVSVLAQAAPQVGGVTIHQRWPWSAKIDVVYDLRGTDRPVDIEVAMTTNGAPVAVPKSSLEGEWMSVESGTHKLTWDPMAAGLGDSVKELKGLRVSLTPVMERRYMIVDLDSALEKTVAARVSYTNEVVGTGADAAGNRAWDDAYKTSKLVLRRIPAGTFRMGSFSTDTYRSGNEVLRQVCISKPFYIGVFEFTQAQLDRIGYTTEVSLFTNATYRAMRPVDHAHYCHIIGGGYTDIVRYPSAYNSSIIGKLRTLVGSEIGFHLPTEAQWEYAARAGSRGVVPGGPETYATGAAEQQDIFAAGNTSRDVYYTAKSNVTPDEGGTKPVGSYAPNAWGLYDVLGNVSECSRDWYAEGGYGDGKPYLVDPSPTKEQGVQGWAGTGVTPYTYRGGGYCNSADQQIYYNSLYCRLPSRRPGRWYCYDVECAGFRVFAPVPEE